jgi:hypothetical protein
VRKLHDVSVRGRGGFYFVAPGTKDEPTKYEDEIARLEKLVELLDNGSGESYLSIAPQVDAEKSRKAIHKAFITGLRDKITMFKEELENDSLKKRGLKNRIDDFKELRDEIEFYKDALSFQADDLAKDLEKLTKVVTAKLTG